MTYANPTALPARTLTDALLYYITGDLMLDAVSFMNNHTSDLTVTIKDGNGKVFEKALSIPAGTRQQLPLSQAGNPLQQGVYFAGGIQMLASTTALVDVWISARTPGPPVG